VKGKPCYYDTANIITIGKKFDFLNKHHQSYQELILAEPNVTLNKAYIDFDLKWPYTPTITGTMFEDFVRAVLSQIVDLIRTMLPLGCIIVAIDSASCHKYAGADNMDYTKISFHFVTNYICFMNEAKNFAEQMVSAWRDNMLKSSIEDITPSKLLLSATVIDTNPYHMGNQCFRMRGAFPGKNGEECHPDRQKKMVPYEGVSNTFSDSLVTYILPGTPKTTNPPRFIIRKQKREVSSVEVLPAKKARVEKDAMDVESDCEDDTSTNDSDEEEEDEIDDILDEETEDDFQLQKRSLNKLHAIIKKTKSELTDPIEKNVVHVIKTLMYAYSDWFTLCVGITLVYNNSDKGYDILDDFSALESTDKYNEEENYKKYKACKRTKMSEQKVTTLKSFFWLIQDRYNKLIKPKLAFAIYKFLNTDEKKLMGERELAIWKYELEGEAIWEHYSKKRMSFTKFMEYFSTRYEAAKEFKLLRDLRLLTKWLWFQKNCATFQIPKSKNMWNHKHHPR